MNMRDIMNLVRGKKNEVPDARMRQVMTKKDDKKDATDWGGEDYFDLRDKNKKKKPFAKVRDNKDQINEEKAKLSKGDFEALIKDVKVRHAAAEAIVRDAIAKKKPNLIMRKGDVSIVLSAGLEDAPYRITRFDKDGPSGHSDFRAGDIKGMAAEVSSALQNGYEIRGQKPSSQG
jgi:hypothetical protein